MRVRVLPPMPMTRNFIPTPPKKFRPFFLAGSLAAELGLSSEAAPWEDETESRWFRIGWYSFIRRKRHWIAARKALQCCMWRHISQTVMGEHRDNRRDDFKRAWLGSSMKFCRKCNQTKEIYHFKVKYIKTGKLQSYCIDCQRQYRKQHYEQNKEKYKKLIEKRKREIRDLYTDYKRNLRCSHCGEDESCCLEFHHRDNNKESNVSSMPFEGNSWESIKKEIDKCIVLCANCHRKEHKRCGQS